MSRPLVPDLIASVTYARDVHETLISLRTTIVLEADMAGALVASIAVVAWIVVPPIVEPAFRAVFGH